MDVLTHDDKIILETIRQHCWAGNTTITMSEWLSVLSSRSPQYVSELLNKHHDDGNIVILLNNRYKLTLKGAYRLGGILLWLRRLLSA